MFRLICQNKLITSMLLAATLSLYGCAAGTVEKQKNDEVNKVEVKEAYSPGDREEFVFRESSDPDIINGYDYFCKNIKTHACYNTLDYDSYVGKKGYFPMTMSVHMNTKGYEFWPVKLETGERFYYAFFDKLGGKYGEKSQIDPVDPSNRPKRFEPEPLVPGSELLVVNKTYRQGRDVYILSNDRQVGIEQLEAAREVASIFKINSGEIAELLFDYEIKKDTVNNLYFVKPHGSNSRNRIHFYIGVDEKSTWLRMKLRYYGDNWLFVTSYKLAADKYRWQSGKLRFSRDHYAGDVWEWIDKEPTKRDIENGLTLAKADESIIRFNGRDYYNDYTLSYNDKKHILGILDLFELMKAGR